MRIDQAWNGLKKKAAQNNSGKLFHDNMNAVNRFLLATRGPGRKRKNRLLFSEHTKGDGRDEVMHQSMKA